MKAKYLFFNIQLFNMVITIFTFQMMELGFLG